MLKNSNNSSKWILNRIIYFCIRIYSRFLAHRFIKFKCSSDSLKERNRPNQNIIYNTTAKMNVCATFATHTHTKNVTIQIANLIHLFSTCRTFFEFWLTVFCFRYHIRGARSSSCLRICPNIYTFAMHSYIHRILVFTSFVCRKKKENTKQIYTCFSIHICIMWVLCVYKNT